MRKIESIQWKLIAIYNVIVLIAMIVSGNFILWQLEEYEYGKIENELQTITGNFMGVELEDDSEESFKEIFKVLLEKNSVFYMDKDTEIYLLSNNGEYLYSSMLAKRDDSNIKLTKSSILSAMNGVSKFERIIEKNEDGKNKEMMGYAAPVMMEGEVKIIIYTRISTENVAETIEKSRAIILFSTFFAMLISVVTGFIFAKTLTDPIKALTITAKKMANGEVFQSVEVKGEDEIGQLTRTFNYMSATLNRTLKDISNEKNKLETVFEHMQDGIIAFNLNGESIHSNGVVLEILDRKKRISKIEDLKKILKIDLDFGNFIKTKTNDLVRYEVDLKSKILNVVVVNYLNDKQETEGVIVMLQDVTEQRKLDNMRKEFVANVSHELRTPLTTVKGYVETLMDGNVDDEEVAKKFFRVINNETDRMTFLVQDLLELSRFDNGQIKCEKKDTDIYELVKDVCIAQKFSIKNKKQNLVVDLPNNEKILFIDAHRITQVMNNIVSNAIKYSEEGATITVFAKETTRKVEIIIKDTGMGIPKEDLKRVFERFYRVDKARSRAMGGTGLGLPIAKEIMQLHDGDIIIESEYKVGTTARIIFPNL